MGEIYNQGQVLFNMALVHRDMGDLSGACTTFEKALQIFESLDAAPCIAQARLNLGITLGLKGQADEADEHFDYAIRLQEELGALPDLCEGYLAKAQFMVREGRSKEADFYLSRAETLISRTDYQPLQILLHTVKGELHQKAGRYREAESSFERALSQARRLSHPYEEAKALSNLGRLALQTKDYPSALTKLRQALAAMSRLGAMHDVSALRIDLASLFRFYGDHARADEMAAMAERQEDSGEKVVILQDDLADLLEEGGKRAEAEGQARRLSAGPKRWDEKLQEALPPQLWGSFGKNS
jgi:tetratricopeptide (TPR) repeat protein